jgi:hypothetical protein
MLIPNVPVQSKKGVRPLPLTAPNMIKTAKTYGYAYFKVRPNIS